jgi:hypothetical protein
MRDRRHELIAGARGRTVELGAGTGLNLEHYTADVDELILTEPFEPMARRLRARAEAGGYAAATRRPAAFVLAAVEAWRKPMGAAGSPPV